ILNPSFIKLPSLKKQNVMSQRWLSVWLWFYCNVMMAQVGINTIDPQAQLDISSSNSVSPDITDGILIPRIENFPTNQPTAAQDGMLVYLKRTLTDHPIGFYYWEAGKSEWVPMTADPRFNFYREGTSIPSEGV